MVQYLAALSICVVFLAKVNFTLTDSTEESFLALHIASWPARGCVDGSPETGRVMNHWRGFAAATTAGIGLRKTPKVVIISCQHLMIYLYRIVSDGARVAMFTALGESVRVRRVCCSDHFHSNTGPLRNGRLEKSLADMDIIASNAMHLQTGRVKGNSPANEPASCPPMMHLCNQPSLGYELRAVASTIVEASRCTYHLTTRIYTMCPRVGFGCQSAL